MKQWFERTLGEFADWWFDKADAKSKATSLLMLSLLVFVVCLIFASIFSFALCFLPKSVQCFILLIASLAGLWLGFYWIFK